MGLFDSVRQGLQNLTPAGWLGLYDDNSVDYNNLFQSQATMYQQQIAERNKLAGSIDVANANLASSTLLTGGSKPSVTGPMSNDFTSLAASDADAIALQQKRNKEAQDAWLRQIAANIDINSGDFGGRV